SDLPRIPAHVLVASEAPDGSAADSAEEALRFAVDVMNETAAAVRSAFAFLEKIDAHGCLNVDSAPRGITLQDGEARFWIHSLQCQTDNLDDAAATLESWFKPAFEEKH